MQHLSKVLPYPVIAGCRLKNSVRLPSFVTSGAVSGEEAATVLPLSFLIEAMLPRSAMPSAP